MHARISWREAVRFEAQTGSGHAFALDGPPEAGGRNAGARPMELILVGVAGCAAYDVVHILRRGHLEVSGCTAEVEAERAPDPPRVFTRIRLHFVVSGAGLSDSKVARAVRLSAEKYCSASIMLSRGGVAVEHSYRVVDTGDGASEERA